MIERVYRFGKDGCLVGVLTEPEVEVYKEGTPIVLLMPAGRIHRVGPHRLNVTLARQLASLGFMSFRFDLGGIGDSETPRDSKPSEERAVDEIREAMNFLSRNKGVGQFVPVGLCSGADDAFRVAIVDPRIVAAVLIDGYAYRTWGFYARHYLRRSRHYGQCLLNLSKWQVLFKRVYSKVSASNHGSTVEGEADFRILPQKKTVIVELKKMIERDVNLLFIYTIGLPDYYNYQDQFYDMFGSIDFRGKVQYQYFGEANHIFTLASDRNRLIQSICAWMQARYLPRKEEWEVEQTEINRTALGQVCAGSSTASAVSRIVS